MECPPNMNIKIVSSVVDRKEDIGEQLATIEESAELVHGFPFYKWVKDPKIQVEESEMSPIRVFYFVDTTKHG